MTSKTSFADTSFDINTPEIRAIAKATTVFFQPRVVVVPDGVSSLHLNPNEKPEHDSDSHCIRIP